MGGATHSRPRLYVEGDGWSRPCPGRFTNGEDTHYPLCRWLDVSGGRSGLVWVISPTLGFEPRMFQPVASRYTGNTVPAAFVTSSQLENVRPYKLTVYIMTRFGCLCSVAISSRFVCLKNIRYSLFYK